MAESDALQKKTLNPIAKIALDDRKIVLSMAWAGQEPAFVIFYEGELL